MQTHTRIQGYIANTWGHAASLYSALPSAKESHRVKVEPTQEGESIIGIGNESADRRNGVGQYQPVVKLAILLQSSPGMIFREPTQRLGTFFGSI